MSTLSITLDKDDVKRLVRKLGRVKAVDSLRPAMERSTARLQRGLADYPAPKRKKQPPKSQKQRYFLRMLAERGGIPYRRTGNLGRGWTMDIGEHGDTLEGTVGNNISYGPYVQGETTQAAYHQGTWQTDHDVIFKQSKAIIDDFADAIEDALAKG